MLNPIASFCVYWAEMFIAYTYFSGIFEKRFSTIKCILFGLVLFSSGSILNLAFSNNTTINLFSFLLTTTLFATFCFRGKAVQRLFYSFVLIVINAALEAVIISLSTYVTGTAFLERILWNFYLNIRNRLYSLWKSSEPSHLLPPEP